MTPQEAAAILIAEMDRQGMTDNDVRAGTAAIAMGESLMTPHTETPYTHTADDRIRTVFGSRVAALTDAQLDVLKADPEAFFERVYGGLWGAKNLGNTEMGDGYRYRGRTLLQLTGRANYAELAKRIGVDIVTDPDLANDPQNSAGIAVAYMLWRYKGGGFDKMLAAVGNNTPDIRAIKERYYAQFTANGQFDYRPEATSAPAAAIIAAPQSGAKVSRTLRQGMSGADVAALQRALSVAADGEFGPHTAMALRTYQVSHNLAADGVAGPLTLASLGLAS